MEVVNSIYFKFYYSFASLGELATLGQAETVTGSIFEKLDFADIIYVFIPFIFLFVHKHLVKTVYYSIMSIVEKGAKMWRLTFFAGIVFLALTFASATSSDFSKLAKRWNRIYIVERFGMIMYQGDDLIQSLIPKINGLFGYEAGAQKFIKYFTDPERSEYTEENKYTNLLKGYNIVFVHMEGMQTFLMDVKFNGEEATPNLNKLANEGMFFKNFYPQVSTGTSSDTEFTLLTSLMPASSGTIFTSYYDREYITIPKLLKEQGYTTFSMHGNLASMWNRATVHPLLGYDKEHMYFADSFKYNNDLNDPENMDVINLGINDKLFFKQAIPILENLEKNSTNYMGTIITLSNHSPFKFLDKYGPYDMSSTFEECDLNNICITKTTDYLMEDDLGKNVGSYITSAHYADSALGEFLEYIKDSESFNNTVFVFYGDHDVKLSHKAMNYFYNYDYKTGDLKDEDDPSYITYDEYDHELNKNTPLIIWTKNEKLKRVFTGEVDYVMGMYDIMPTFGNMLGIKNKFAMGHDIFNIKYNNVVVFPNGNFTTDLIYYNNSAEQYKVLKDGAEIPKNYISDLIKKTEDILEVSNAIEVHDLIKYEGNKVKKLNKE